MNKKISNVDAVSALFDRLITERIKHFFFVKEGNAIKVAHQNDIILELKTRIADTFQECLMEHDYDVISEQRTFNVKVIDDLDGLIMCNLHIGEGDRMKQKQFQSEEPSLSIMLEQEKRVRTACEGRGLFKNKLDNWFINIFRRK